MMFYNGFNLLIDMILAVLVWKAARYTAEGLTLQEMSDIWTDGQIDTLDAIDAGHIYKSECNGELVWSMTEEYVNA